MGRLAVNTVSRYLFDAQGLLLGWLGTSPLRHCRVAGVFYGLRFIQRIHDSYLLIRLRYHILTEIYSERRYTFQLTLWVEFEVMR